MKSKVKIAIMASGRGSNAKAIIDFSQHHDATYEVVLILSNRKKAGVHEHAQASGIPSSTFERSEFYESKEVLEELRKRQVELIVLAGFLWLIPSYLVAAYPRRIVNIHPALLPKYGGKGMYGLHIHKAVKENQEKQSGMTVHFVNEIYDEGAIIFQAKCQLAPSDDAGQIAHRVLQLEHHFYPRIINGVSRRLVVN